MKLGPLALPRRVPLAVVARDASNPSTGLFAKQQVAGRLGLEPRPTVLETAMLPLHHQPMSGILELNQKPQTYQVCALTDCANARSSGSLK